MYTYSEEVSSASWMRIEGTAGGDEEGMWFIAKKCGV